MRFQRKQSHTTHRVVPLFLFVSPRFRRSTYANTPLFRTHPYPFPASSVTVENPIVAPQASTTDTGRSEHTMPGYSVYHIEDILTAILRYCDWKTVMSVARAATTGRPAGRSHVRGLLQAILSPYIGRDAIDFNNMMKALATSRGGITGSIVRAVLEHNADYTLVKDDAPNHYCYDLNIIVPRGGMSAIQQCMKSMGYRVWRSEAVSVPRAMTVENIVTSSRPHVQGQGVSLQCLDSSAATAHPGFG